MSLSFILFYKTNIYKYNITSITYSSMLLYLKGIFSKYTIIVYKVYKLKDLKVMFKKLSELKTFRYTYMHTYMYNISWSDL